MFYFKKIINLIVIFLFFATGIVLTVNAQLGVSPWDVFHIGLTNYTNLTLGQASQLTGLIIILISIFLGEFPGIGTFLNMYFIGFFVDLIIKYNWIPETNVIWQQYIMLFLGIYIMGWATFLYLNIGLGSGPRDSLMVGLIKKTRQPLWKIRGFIEGGVLIIGFLMGGIVGIGTVFIAFLTGFVIQHCYNICKKNSNNITHRTLIDEYNIIRKFLRKFIEFTT